MVNYICIIKYVFRCDFSFHVKIGHCLYIMHFSEFPVAIDTIESRSISEFNFETLFKCAFSLAADREVGLKGWADFEGIEPDCVGQNLCKKSLLTKEKAISRVSKQFVCPHYKFAGLYVQPVSALSILVATSLPLIL
jgi:hypothetical protein